MKNIKHIKTTIIGIILFISSFAYLNISLQTELGTNIWIFFGILISGIAFIFFPDDFIRKLKNFLGGISATVTGNNKHIKYDK